MVIQAPELTASQKAAIKTKNVSDSIRYLDAEEYSRADIARILGKRYQHVRNVLVQSGRDATKKKKTTFTLRTSTFEAFENLVKEIGLRRDSYLSSLLEDALSALATLSPNSPDTQELLKQYYRSDSSALLELGELVRVNFSLNDALVQKMNETCREKQVPRDLFLDGLLEAASMALGHAAETIGDPIYFCENQGIKFCNSYLLSEDEAEQLRQQIKDEALITQAISIVKDITISAATRSYSQLSTQTRRRIQGNPDIRQAIDRLREKSESSVDLDDLIE